MLFCTHLIPRTAAQLGVLVGHLRALEPAARIVVLDLTTVPPPLDGVDLVRPESLVEAVDLAHLAMVSRTADELAEHLRPVLVTHALELDPHVVFVDPETLLLESPRALLEAASPVALARRMPRHLPTDGLLPSPRDILERGVIADDLGAVDGSNPAARAAVDWWTQRSRARELAQRTSFPGDHPVFFSLPDVRHVPWLDVVPTMFDVAVLDDGWSRSVWNLSGREIQEGPDGGLLEGDAPIRSLDLRGIDLDQPWRSWPRFAKAPRVRLSLHPALWRRCSAWIDAVRSAASDLPPVTDRFGTFPDGSSVEPRVRRLHERLLAGPDAPVDDPFDPDGFERYQEWLAAPGLGSTLSRYLTAVWSERDDLCAAFPDAPNGDAQAFRAWIHSPGGAEAQVPVRFQPPLPPAPPVEGSPNVAEPSAPTRGVLVSGFFNSVMGLGEAARLVAGAVESSGIEHATLTYSATVAEQGSGFAELGDHGTRLDTHVACVNVDTFDAFVATLGPEYFDGRHTIGLWFWEASTIPDRFLGAFDHVDEIWVASEFVGEVMSRYTDKPVNVFPQPVPVPERGTATREELGLPEEFTFLFAFDFNSVIERKNPLGLVEAFTRAFAPGEGPKLVIKTINGFRRLADFDRLLLATIDRDDIEVVDEFFPGWKRDAWTAECDCYVSLHRSEGFGLTMAEAMASGKPVIATRSSGNLNFMDDDNSLLVDAVEASVPAGCEPYPEGALWADPDLDQAAAHMRRVYEDEALRARLGAAGRTRILERHDRAVTAAWIVERLGATWRARDLAADAQAAEAAPSAVRRMLRKVAR